MYFNDNEANSWDLVYVFLYKKIQTPFRINDADEIKTAEEKAFSTL